MGDDIVAGGFPTMSSRTLQHGGVGEKSALVPGYFKFENGEAKNFLAPLPPLIHIRAEGGIAFRGWRQR